MTGKSWRIRETTPVAFVTRRNGAWLVHFVGTEATDRPEGDNFDAASSVAAAKRSAKQGCAAVATHLRWREAPEYDGWVLEGVEANPLEDAAPRDTPTNTNQEGPE
jgi:hypothetical protein